MRYPKRYARFITARYAAIREREERDRDARCAAARKDPEYAQAERNYSAASLDYARVKASGKDCGKEKAAFEWAEKALSAIASEKGYDLSLHVRCKKCGDTGFVGEKLCSCAMPLYLALIKEDSGTGHIPKVSFDDNLAGNSDCAQSKQLSVLYDKMKEFTEKFATTRVKFILFTGQSGVGKTTLAYATANALMEKGVSVCFVTAFEFNNLMLRYHTTSLAERAKYMDFLLDCDMLIIDDLGTEPILKSVTKEYLYNVIDTRLSDGKKTMVTSNLNVEELMVRYGERTVSRMTNKTYSLARELCGDDLRKFRF